MQLSIEFQKMPTGKLSVSITVTDSGDFPTIDIFSWAGDYPAENEFQLKEDACNRITGVLNTPSEAQRWASEQVNSLKSHLDRWRNIEPPPNRQEKI